MFAEKNKLQTFAVYKETLPKSWELNCFERMKKEGKRSKRHKNRKRAVHPDKNNRELLTNDWAWAILQT